MAGIRLGPVGGLADRSALVGSWNIPRLLMIQNGYED
jgi:hypothetical protein